MDMDKTLPAFIMLKNEVCFFAFMKYKDSYICFPKIVDNYKGKDYNEWFKSTKKEIENYYKYFDGLDAYIYLVPQHDVLKTINPIEFTINRKYKDYKYNFPYYIDTLVNLISEFFDIDKDSIAVEGSLLIDKYKETSDIDMFVYGLENSKKLSYRFRDFCNYKKIRGFSKEEATSYVKKRSKSGYGKTLNQQINQFYRRFYGFIDEKQFSIVCVPKMDEFNYIDLDRKLKFINKFNGDLTITDDKYSTLIPSKYLASDGEKEYLIEIYNHYSINQIKKGEKVHIEGNHYLTEKEENIIILGFWYDTNERVDVL